MQNGLCQCCVPLVLLACMSQDRADQYRAEQSSPAGILSHVLSSIQRISSFPIFERGVTVRIHEGGRRHLGPPCLRRRGPQLAHHGLDSVKKGVEHTL